MGMPGMGGMGRSAGALCIPGGASPSGGDAGMGHLGHLGHRGGGGGEEEEEEGGRLGGSSRQRGGGDGGGLGGDGGGLLAAPPTVSRAKRAGGRRKPTKFTSAVAEAAASQGAEDDDEATPLAAPGGAAAVGGGGHGGARSVFSEAAAAPLPVLLPGGGEGGAAGRGGYCDAAAAEAAATESGGPGPGGQWSAAFNVSGSAITGEIDWAIQTVHLSAEGLGIYRDPALSDSIALLPLSGYVAKRLTGLPDAVGCIQLEPAVNSPFSSKGSVWLRLPTRSAPEEQRSRALDRWHAQIDRSRKQLENEAAAATYALLSSQLGGASLEEARAQAAVWAASQSADGGASAAPSSSSSSSSARGQPPSAALSAGRCARTASLGGGSGGGGGDGGDDLLYINRTLSLKLCKERGMSVDDTRLLEQRLASAGAVTKGGTLVKFVLGRRKRHERFVQAKGTGKEATLSWRGGAARILKTSGGGTWERGLQREQRLSEEELRRCFQVVLDGKVLALMAASTAEKAMWVEGLNALVEGVLPG
jgi:hypothetical protein